MHLQFLSTPSVRRATRPVEDAGWSQQISIHSLREEGDLELERGLLRFKLFLSTPSARRATNHKPRDVIDCHISIHALREEGDTSATSSVEKTANFYPRPPRGGRPKFLTLIAHILSNFYPRPPRGGRPRTATKKASSGRFLSTPSVRRATGCRWVSLRRNRYFYPRPPRGGRLLYRSGSGMVRTFLSTPSVRRATF